MIDLLSVSIWGVNNYSRARVLWQEGILKVFTVDGLKLNVPSQAPARLPGYLRRWAIMTDHGPLVARGRCITCGGPKWWRVIRQDADELWGQGHD